MTTSASAISLREQAPLISVVIPIYNEEGNIRLLCERLLTVLRPNCVHFEVIVVNDGSSDNSLAELESCRREAHPEVKVVDFRRNYGQTAAMMAGFDHACGDVIVLDRRRPAERPRGHPAAAGQARRRLRRRLRLAQGPQGCRASAQPRQPHGQPPDPGHRRSAARLRLHAEGLSPRRARGMRLYGEMHRFIPIYASWQGARSPRCRCGTIRALRQVEIRARANV